MISAMDSQMLATPASSMTSSTLHDTSNTGLSSSLSRTGVEQRKVLLKMRNQMIRKLLILCGNKSQTYLYKISSICSKYSLNWLEYNCNVVLGVRKNIYLVPSSSRSPTSASIDSFKVLSTKAVFKRSPHSIVLVM